MKKPPSSPSSIFLVSSFFLVFILTRFSLVFSIDAAATANLPLQLISLLSLKSSLKDPFNTFHDWDPTPTLSSPGFRPLWCRWSGIKCADDNKSGRVTGLDLSGRNLSGNIPEDIRYLLHLHHLNLSGNLFDGPLPPVIFEFSFLRTLDFSNNSFNSTFPPRISRLKSLALLNGFSNNFVGALPREIARLRNLEYLNLGGSYFSGEIPASYGSFQKLKFLYLAGNLLTGAIPPELGFLNSLENLQLGYNAYTGELPIQLFSLSNLTFLDISQSNLSGVIPPEISNLTKLEILYLFKNHLTGEIPGDLSSLTLLKELDLSNNHLSGAIPASLSSLDKLSVLSLMNNNLTGEIPPGIGFLPNLQRLSLWNNSLSGILPQNLGSNSRLEKLDVSSNYLSGPIPANLCLGDRLNKLILFSNQFSGELPASLANCTALNRLRVQNNKLNGFIPLGFGFLPNFTFMDVSDNVFSGAIPKDLGNAVKLEFLNVSENSFNADLPDNIWSAPNLKIFSGSYSALKGKIPDFRGCQSLYKIELEGNNLTGDIPWDIQHCEKLISLNLRRNSLTGIIPWEISTLPSITDVDLSHNLLTGTIPSNFGSCRTLESFNVSYNQLTGPLPSSGPIFSTLHPSSFAGNNGLCGNSIQRPCRPEIASSMEIKLHPKKTAGAIVWIIAAAFGICLFVLIAACRYLHANYRRRFPGDRDAGPWKLTAFQRLNFTAEDVLECLSISNKVIGMGSTGTVYKVEMPGGEIIAVKKLWGIHKDTVRKKRGVLAEVEVLGKIRHRNIVRLLGCCTNNQGTMLLYEYMPNGSLDDLLHGTNKGINVVADWVTRYKILLGVAQGICYLHHDCDPVIIHRDLKPSNILLDSKIEARVADFGVAKLVQNDESMSIIAGSYGYIAPEYAYSLQVDVKSDIYSYGVVLMEVLTGKRSMDSEFGEGNSIVDWVRSKLKVREGVTDVLDKNAGASCPLVREEMMLLLRIALLCTSRNPADRPSMRDVVSMLQEAKPKRKLAAGSGESGGGNGGVIANLIQKTTVEC
ncbi:leucine-rich repeat receptor-like protein kinase TDR [Ipomoea triloba]|uniref:leucine-rich repeat receptor-like protein kinase TDR n=1 Tax=Ipomoea triloba TaxID=35885 RepID=UPI00125D4DCD|nr:leucine-rich repeat receptor-like protein kinase TDR [Ipomoea triloba]